MKPKTIDEYLALPYVVEVMHEQADDQSGWFARVVELPGCMTQADTFEEIEPMVKDAMRAWILTALEAGLPVPEPDAVAEGSGHLSVRVPRSLHKELIAAAAREGVSVSTYVAVTLGRSLGVSPAPQAIHEKGASYDTPC